MHNKIPKLLLAIIGTLLIAPQVWATTVLEMNLAALTDGAGKVFRGTVLDVTETSVQAGGGELPALKYTLRVDEAFKGNFATVKGQQVAEFMVVGSLKQYHAGRTPIPGFPLLQVGSDYLLMVAQPGPVGLTATMGLGQGAFNIFKDPATRETMAVNGVNNFALFRGMGSGLPASGPIAYSALAGHIRAAVDN